MFKTLILSQPSGSFVGCPTESAKTIVFMIRCFANSVAVDAASVYSSKDVCLSGATSGHTVSIEAACPYKFSAREIFSLDHGVGLILGVRPIVDAQKEVHCTAMVDVVNNMISKISTVLNASPCHHV